VEAAVARIVGLDPALLLDGENFVMSNTDLTRGVLPRRCHFSAAPLSMGSTVESQVFNLSLSLLPCGALFDDVACV